MPRPPLAALLCTTLAVPTAAQALTLDKVGGGLGQPTTLPIHGTPGELYFLLLDVTEQPTFLPDQGVTLDITTANAGLTFALPGWAGFLNGSGSASPQAIVPNDPLFASLTLSLQVLGGDMPWRTSNLVRLTPKPVGTFSAPLNQPPVPITGGGAAVAPDGALLFVGGAGPVAQRYLSRTEEWQAAGATFGVGLFSQTTGLPDGRVLFTGGLDPLTGQTTAAAAVYDPVLQTTTTLSMAQARAGHGASVMGNGKVLISGGLSALDLTNPLSLFTGLLVSTEIFDPVTNLFSAGPNMLEARALHTSTTLTNGQVLVAGGISLLPIVNIPAVSATAYRFNPTTNSFGLPAVFSGPRFLHSAAPLDGGRVLLVGGLNLDLTTFLTTGQITDLIITTRTDCQVYTPAIAGFGTFATVNGMQVGRAAAAVARLPAGGALIAGGFALTIDPTTGTVGFQPTATADRFASSPNSLTPTGSMASARAFPSAFALPDATLMVLGGTADAEIYQY